jgi:hypothetical protein
VRDKVSALNNSRDRPFLGAHRRAQAATDACPCLEVRGVADAVVDGDVADGDILGVLELAIILNDTAHCEAQAGVPVLFVDYDVSAVGFS